VYAGPFGLGRLGGLVYGRSHQAPPVHHSLTTSPPPTGSLRLVVHTPSLRRRLLLALAGAMLLLGATGAVARAESYGELAHFGAAGTGPR